MMKSANLFCYVFTFYEEKMLTDIWRQFEVYNVKYLIIMFPFLMCF